MTAVEVWTFAAALVVAVAAGLAAGAIVNALADRVVGVDEPVWSATKCRKCLAPLPPGSPLALPELWRPRVCAQCGRRASLRRPLTQLALAALLPLLLAHAVLNPGHPLARNAAPLPFWALLTLGVVACCALAFTFVVDLEHRLIYDLAVFPPMLLILATAAWLNQPALAGLLLSGALAAILFLLFYGLGWAIYRQEALGFGDVKLAALMGVVAGWPGVMTALLITIFAGFVTALLLLATGAKERRAFIPFGVFMALGSVIALLTGPFPW